MKKLQDISYKNLLPVVSAVALLWFVLVIWVWNVKDQTRYQLTTAVLPLPEVYKTRIAALKEDLQKAKDAAVCSDINAKGEIVYCGESLNTIRRIEKQIADEIQSSLHPNSLRVEKVVQSIRTLRNNQSLSITFVGTAKDPNSTGPRMVEYYRDDKGVVYMVDRYSFDILDYK